MQTPNREKGYNIKPPAGPNYKVKVVVVGSFSPPATFFDVPPHSLWPLKTSSLIPHHRVLKEGGKQMSEYAKPL